MRKILLIIFITTIFSEEVSFKIALQNFPFSEEYVYVVKTTDDNLIENCREQLLLPIENRNLHINGQLDYTNGGFNEQWNWHILPDQWILAELSIELCDGVPSDIENNLDYWIENVGSFCAWGSFVYEEITNINLGDINGDGNINVLDVVVMINIILNDTYYDPVADLNSDGIVDILDIVHLVNIILLIDDMPTYSDNPDLDGQFLDAVLINRNPDCRAYTMDANDGDYGSSLILDISNGINDAISDVYIDMVIASNWNPTDFDYDSVTLTLDPELATHCRMISNMIPNHTFGVEVTGPDGDGWINAIDHSDIEVTYIPVDPVLTDTPTDTPRNPPTYDFDGILLNGVGIAMDSGVCYNPGVFTGPPSLQSNEAGNTSGCGPQNSWFELQAFTIWEPDAEYMYAIFDNYFAHGYKGTYHYHALTHPLQEDTDQTQPPSNGDGSPVIGFAPDGFPIYGHWFIDSNNQLVMAESGYETYLTDSRTPIETALHGTPPTPWDLENNPDDFSSDFGLVMGRYEEDWYFAGSGNLDECNGAYDVNGDYGYYITDKYPFTPPCTFGAREPSFSKQSPTLP